MTDGTVGGIIEGKSCERLRSKLLAPAAPQRGSSSFSAEVPVVETSAWSTNARLGWAFRAAGRLTVVRHRDVFFLLSEQIKPLKGTTLSAAVQEADALHPPADWRYAFGVWVEADWQVKPCGGGWHVFSRSGEQKSRRSFERPDLARKWCEIRRDRVGLNLRGPKPRTGKPAEAPSLTVVTDVVG